MRHLEPLNARAMGRENVQRLALLGVVDANLQNKVAFSSFTPDIIVSWDCDEIILDLS